MIDPITQKPVATQADLDVRLSGEIMDAYVNIGGRVFSTMDNMNVSIQLPLGNKTKRNFILEVEKHVDDLGLTVGNPTYFLARIFYRFTF